MCQHDIIVIKLIDLSICLTASQNIKIEPEISKKEIAFGVKMYYYKL